MKKNKYKKLASNTIIFSFGTFSSKIFSLLLNNLYTKNFEPSEFYVKNLLETTALFLLPIFTFSLTEAVVRYGMDKKYDKKQVFSTAFVLTVGGMILMALIVPILGSVSFFTPLKEYTALLIFYIVGSSFRSLCSQFVLSREKVKLFAFDGILTTMLMFVLNVIFISRLGMGVKGFMLSTILSDTCSAVFLFITAGLHKFLDIRSCKLPLGKNMLKFTFPLIPTILMWSITELSDRIFIGNMKSDNVFLGESAAGLYSAAAILPNLLSMMSSVFYKAWNISAIAENDSTDRNEFYEKVYVAYESAMFIGSAGLLLFIKPISAVLINYDSYPEYEAVYIYAPLLITAAVFNCLNQFLFGIYTALKHTINAFLTCLAACASNLLLNLILIPIFGIQGAAAATLISYLLCYVIRIFDTRRYVPFKFNIKRTCISSASLLAASLLIIFNVKGLIMWVLLLTAVIVLINLKNLIKIYKIRSVNR